MNNSKGQVLVLFIVLLPALLTLLTLVIDLGLLYSEDKHIESSMKEAIEYGLKHQSDADISEQITQLLNQNISDIDNIEIEKQENYLQIKVEKEYVGLFQGLFSNNIYDIYNSYYGYINEGQQIINKE